MPNGDPQDGFATLTLMMNSYMLPRGKDTRTKRQRYKKKNTTKVEKPALSSSRDDCKPRKTRWTLPLNQEQAQKPTHTRTCTPPSLHSITLSG